MSKGAEKPQKTVTKPPDMSKTVNKQSEIKKTAKNGETV